MSLSLFSVTSAVFFVTESNEPCDHEFERRVAGYGLYQVFSESFRSRGIDYHPNRPLAWPEDRSRHSQPWFCNIMLWVWIFLSLSASHLASAPIRSYSLTPCLSLILHTPSVFASFQIRRCEWQLAYFHLSFKCTRFHVSISFWGQHKDIWISARMIAIKP